LLSARAQKDNHNIGFLRDSDGKTIGTNNQRNPMVPKKKKPIQVV